MKNVWPNPVAMLISDQPDVMELELDRCGFWTNEIFDTYRPTSRHEVGHADTSLFGYLDALDGAYDDFIANVGDPTTIDLGTFDLLLNFFIVEVGVLDAGNGTGSTAAVAPSSIPFQTIYSQIVTVDGQGVANGTPVGSTLVL